MPRLNLFVCVTALAVAALCVGCQGNNSGSSPTSSATKQQSLTLGLTYIPNVQFAPFYVESGQNLASTGKQHFDLRLRHHGGDEGLFNALLTGKEDAVVAFGDEAIQANSAGMELSIIGVLYQKYPVVVISKADSGINAWSDLRGKTVGLPGKFGSNWFGFQVGLAAHGLSLADVEIAEIGYTQQSQLQTGKVDAVVGFSNNDLVRFQLAGMSVQTLELPADTPMVGAAIITTQKFAAANPLACQALVNGMARAIHQISKQPDLALTWTKKHDETLNNAAALQAAEATNLATLELTRLPDYDPDNPGRSAAVDVQKVAQMITLLDSINALDSQVSSAQLQQDLPRMVLAADLEPQP